MFAIVVVPVRASGFVVHDDVHDATPCALQVSVVLPLCFTTFGVASSVSDGGTTCTVMDFVIGLPESGMHVTEKSADVVRPDGTMTPIVPV